MPDRPAASGGAAAAGRGLLPGAAASLTDRVEQPRRRAISVTVLCSSWARIHATSYSSGNDGPGLGSSGGSPAAAIAARTATVDVPNSERIRATDQPASRRDRSHS